jgi:hypothetical protein
VKVLRKWRDFVDEEKPICAWVAAEKAGILKTAVVKGEVAFACP